MLKSKLKMLGAILLRVIVGAMAIFVVCWLLLFILLMFGVASLVEAFLVALLIIACYAVGNIIVKSLKRMKNKV